ncbi:hypothetical protein N7448_010176 [Penicillium atrosanguineum]|uniref:Apple domain-containing protein n=1 Tax=Penicillium atrosanguineum TaxID=1132637 RepID=A0A9W9GFI2_9EURO|nr:negative cofactor 2 transcription regulator complex subunit ncb2 [Penicillium atrosanguineum]KAJ5118469.1 hypothetical protein N7526_010106 [Penicillium atrosanguineum]KAJ5119507.1 hypothetical protein N7448_010176 [Penicillium atrosanguineum]KAJ5296507.1 negative cofactor 2 transcription regulator complex subunit ncb2 [Penicillium atrosanguineum]KAJ5299272.1 hypothetical protein N7476_010829 [Penicillium atrosanguineum]
MSITRFALAVGFLLGHVSAKPSGVSSLAASSQAHTPIVSCRTKLAMTSVALVPTTTITRQVHDPTPLVILSTTRDTVTVTPVVTVTGIDYETSTVTSIADTITDTFSTTSTEFDTATVTITPDPSTTTVFATVSTTSTSTTTISASAGFTPLAGTMPTPTAVKRSLPEEEDECSPGLDDYKYPEEVICHEKIILKTTTVSTVTGSPVTLTATASTTTVTITTTITTSSVIVPTDVSTTLSYSTTSTITETSSALAETSTVTATSTVTGALAIATTLGACAANNIAGLPLSSDFGSFAGQYIFEIEFTRIAGQRLTVGDTTSAYDCCVSCQEDSNCAMSYYIGSGASTHYCYLMETTICSFSYNYAVAYVGNSVTTMQMSNGNCGHGNGMQG